MLFRYRWSGFGRRESQDGSGNKQEGLSAYISRLCQWQIKIERRHTRKLGTDLLVNRKEYKRLEYPPDFL